MRSTALLFGLAGVGLGVFISLIGFNPNNAVRAASNDRYQDFVMCTGAVTINPRLQCDGVWLLDYRSGKLLGTAIDKSLGKIMDWAEVDLAAEFNVMPKEDVHFMMASGYLSQGQSALYIAETTTGKFGVYTMGPGSNNNSIVIRRHDMKNFRMVQPAVQPAAASIPGMPGVPASVVPPQHTPATVPAVPAPSPFPAMTAPPPPPTVPQVPSPINR